jgi:hypothetical protein
VPLARADIEPEAREQELDTLARESKQRCSSSLWLETEHAYDDFGEVRRTRYVPHLERLERKPLWAALVALEIAAWGLVFALEETWSAVLLGAVLVTMAVWAWRHVRQKSK